MEEGLVRRLMSALKCNVCGRHFETGSIKVLGHRDDLWFLGVFCPTCRSQSFIAAIIREDSAPETVTDLTQAELDRFSQNQIVADDVLDIHSFLKDFDGDFTEFFTKEDHKEYSSQ